MPSLSRVLLSALGAFLLWNVAVSVALVLLPPLPALGLALLFAVWFLQHVVVRRPGRGAARRWAMLRLRPLRGEALRWTLVGVPVLAALSWSAGEVYIRLVPVPPEVFDPFDFLTGTAAGRLALTVLAVAVAPLVEELVFRGWIQRPLERRWGPAAGIGLAAALFAAAHMLPWILPLHLLLGVVFGWAVYATRSIWAGVILHAANNAVAVAGLGAASRPELGPTVWEAGATPGFWIALAALLLSAAAALAVARRMRARPVEV